MIYLNKLGKRILCGVVVLCVVVLIVDIVYVCYQKMVNKEESKYFDSINSFISKDSYLVAVGSNNGNDELDEKAKITKYNKNYEKVWEKFYNRGYNSTFYKVVADDDGYVAVGNFQKTKKEKKEGTHTALFVKYDNDGNEEFYKTLQILGDSTFKSVVVVDDGYIVVGQSIYEKSTLGLSEQGGAIIVKYDQSGNLVWQKNYGGNKSGLFNDVVVYDGFIYAVGKNYGRVGIMNKYTNEGEYITTGSYEYTDTLGFTDVEIVGDELIAVGSKKISEDEYDHETDALVVRFDEDCDNIGSVTYKGRGLDRFNTITHDEKNNLIIVGHSAILDKNKSTKTKNVYTYNGILAKYKQNLKEIYVMEYGQDKNNNDYFTDVHLMNGKYLVSGYSKYKKDGYFSKFITYNTAGKVLEVH